MIFLVQCFLKDDKEPVKPIKHPQWKKHYKNYFYNPLNFVKLNTGILQHTIRPMKGVRISQGAALPYSRKEQTFQLVVKSSEYICILEDILPECFP